MTDNRCCGGTSGTCGCGRSETPGVKRTMKIDLLYLDLEVCDRCTGTDSVLEAAMRDAAPALAAMGIGAVLDKVHVTTEEQAKALRFGTSPTIRIDGHDIQPAFSETLCESCGDLCGEDTDCRVWSWQGREYTVPPKGLLVEAIMAHAVNPMPVVGPTGDPDDFEVPENLKGFFGSVKPKESKGCCGGGTCC